MACNPSYLNADAKCFECLSIKEQLAIQTLLLARIAGGSTDPNTLNAAAVTFQSLSDHGLLSIQAYLLCQINNS